MIMVRSFFRSEIDHSINCAERQDAAPASLSAGMFPSGCSGVWKHGL